MAEFEASKHHCPKDSKSGKPLCWKYNSNAGCATKGGECPYGLHRRMKRNGPHWAIQAQIARRGGFVGTKVLAAPEIDGFIMSLRNAEPAAIKAKRGLPYPNPKAATGGYTLTEQSGVAKIAKVDKENVAPIPNPPGLVSVLPPTTNDLGTEVKATNSNFVDFETRGTDLEESNLSAPPNPLAGVIPLDIGEFDFTELEEGLRSAIYGGDDWLVDRPAPDSFFFS